MVIDWLEQTDHFVIYGAQVVAIGARVAIEHLTGRRPECFAVGKPLGMTWFPEGNPDELAGIPVCPIGEIPKDTFIIVGVTELVQQEVLPFLSESGYANVYPLTQHEEHLLMSRYFESIGKFPLVDI